MSVPEQAPLVAAVAEAVELLPAEKVAAAAGEPGHAVALSKVETGLFVADGETDAPTVAAGTVTVPTVTWASASPPPNTFE